jgi:hypoxanthine phosphoribosyltransferase
MMDVAAISRSTGILSFDRRGFDDACAELMRLVVEDGLPDALIGIRTGGFYVADAMADAMNQSMPVLSVTCRRPSTRYKGGLSGLKAIIAKLPRPIVDRLRMIEHAVLTRRSRPTRQVDFQFDAAEIAALDIWLEQAGSHPRIVIVDDAVDSGATLSHVLRLVTDRAPAGATICCAVITVTTAQPLIQPDYALYRQQLCRFPWSLDG